MLVNQLSLSPNLLPGTFPVEAVMSPRRARALSQERPLPFLVDARDELGAPGAASNTSTRAATAKPGLKLVFGGLALRPVFVAGVVALAGVTGIGLFLGMLLGELMI